MVEVKEAVQNALEYAKEIYQPSQIQGIAVEEIEFSQRRGVWLITLGWHDPARNITTIQQAMSGSRIYKVFIVDNDTGKVIKMEIR